MSREGVCWFAAKVKYQTEKKIKGWLDEVSVENFVPFRTVVMERNGKKIQKEKPLVPGLLFVHTDYRNALSLPVESKISMSYMRNLETRQLLVVPDKQMEDFIFLLDFSEAALKVENTNLKRGDRVRVIKGEFTGIEGELVRIKGHKRVVVRLEGLFSLATTYIPGSYLERI
jgi:transcription antitermination factor NusG